MPLEASPRKRAFNDGVKSIVVLKAKRLAGRFSWFDTQMVNMSSGKNHHGRTIARRRSAALWPREATLELANEEVAFAQAYDFDSFDSGLAAP